MMRAKTLAITIVLLGSSVICNAADAVGQWG